MKIVHIAPNAPYNDYWGYQENILPKYHKKLGHDVALIITNKMHENGKIVEVSVNDYELTDGVKVYRKKYQKFVSKKISEIISYIPVYELLKKIHPDFIFYHGLVSTTIFDVIRYKKENRECTIVQDNHMDYNIGININPFINFIFRSWFRLINCLSISYVDRVYGVTPWRKKYAEEYFGVPTNKTDVLIMGADDEYIDFSKKREIRKKIRRKYNVSDVDFLIVSGGKIDKKKNIDILVKACDELQGNIKLLVFGQMDDEQKNKLKPIFDSSQNIIFIGWVDANKVYDYFFAADLVFFPGQHSVLWEQACASKVPCVFKKWEGMNHVNNGGNSCFITDVNVVNIKKAILDLNYSEEYYKMKEVAESAKTDIYLYSKIARKSLESAKKLK